MKPKVIVAICGIIVLIGVLYFNSQFTVHEGELAIITQFGKPVFMVNVSQSLGRQISTEAPFSVNDLKARFHTLFYVKILFKLTPEIEGYDFFQQLYDNMIGIGCIHQQPKSA